MNFEGDDSAQMEAEVSGSLVPRPAPLMPHLPIEALRQVQSAADGPGRLCGAS